jgi:hypothetical protein
VTIIAYRDGVLAADSLATDVNYDGRCGMVMKIARSPDGEIGGASGGGGDSALFVRWLQDGMQEKDDIWPLDDKETEAFVVERNKRVVYFNRWGKRDTIKAPFHAIGSGAPYALGAMAVGATAEEAVAAAIKLSVWCGGRIQILKLKE